jgi:hypothetical protein
MLRRISNKEVIGPAFTVFVPDIHQVRYAEGNHVAIVEIEGGEGKDGQVDWVIYQATLRGWQPPHATDDFTSDKRIEILSRIGESLTVLEMPYRLA